jgi:hypothetical protein
MKQTNILLLLFLSMVCSHLVAQTSIVLPNACTTCDTDKDGVPDSSDLCPNTPLSTPVNAQGCSLSSNGTAVISAFTNCETDSTGTLTVSSSANATQKITVTVTTAGTYNISAVANGITFSDMGSLLVGTQNIILTASGTPQGSGRSLFTLNTAPSCSFDRTVGTSGGGSGSLVTSLYDFKGTFKEIYHNPWSSNSGTHLVAAISSDNKLFVWGRGTTNDMGYLFANIDINKYQNGIYTPAYLPLPNSEIPVKVANRDGVNPRCDLMVLTQSGKCYGIGGNISSNRGVWVDFSIPGETIIDINDEAFIQTNTVGTRMAITASGKAYYWGLGNSRWDWITQVTQWTQIAFPAGVNSSTFKYTKILNKAPFGFTYFMKGNDGNVYAVGENLPNWADYSIVKIATLLGTGATSTSNDILVKTGTPKKVLFPSGVDIVKIEIGFTNANSYAVALAADGTAYGWGLWKSDNSGTIYHNFAIENASTTNYVVNNPSTNVTGYNLISPHKLKLPSGSSIFKDIMFTGTSAGGYVQTDVGVYTGYSKSRGNMVTMDPLNIINRNTSNIGYSQTYPDNIVDVPNEFSYKSYVLSLFDKIPYISNERIFALTSTGKPYFMGMTDYSSGTDFVSSPSAIPGLGYFYSSVVPWPLPLRTGTMDPFNPNPLY